MRPNPSARLCSRANGAGRCVGTAANDASRGSGSLRRPAPATPVQVLALAEALGWPYEVKRLAFKPLELGPGAAVLRQRRRRRPPTARVAWPRHGRISCWPPAARTRCRALDPPAVGGPHPHRSGGPTLGSARRLRSRGHHARNIASRHVQTCSRTARPCIAQSKRLEGGTADGGSGSARLPRPLICRSGGWTPAAPTR